MSAHIPACPKCGAALSAPPGQAAYTCAYCGTQISVAPPQPAYPQASYPQYPAAYAPQPPTPSQGARPAFLLLPLFFFVAIGAGIYFFINRAVGGGGWNGKGPLVCAGNDKVQARDLKVSVPTGTALTINGNCHVDLVNTDVTARIAVRIAGNGRLTCSGGSIEGTDMAIDASGNARVDLHDTRLVGAITRSGNARVTQ